MKSITYIILIALTLSSCVHVYFVEPQPKAGILLPEVPKELHGKWIDQETKISIDEKGMISYKIREIEIDSMSVEIDTVYSNVLLCDSIKLFKAKQYYVLNYRENNSLWEIYVIEKKTNGDVIFYETREPDFFVKDKNLKLKQAHYQVDEKDTLVETLNPKFEGNVRFNSATFTGQMKLKTIKKIAQKENIINILKQDGTVSSPNYVVEN
jgi:hypothetical protein